ncbi:hypothetical protein SJAG_00553 [Schizosaccharomyces japonicus yFS275]|uniref:Golgi apparatus membrane protein TVP23 n=1 Tax=Schizosaccharomyces japonicus (strain yFS275 / FY16936) TaxID=402676 RepID=B6JVY8_SCHJY|nr:hypothetical protein SJAG_00553 [Schizosaccharomyces japonicus yFS275]EEB05539.1 hypothetical protein SJAG_00553 [Schizosaccharomyces japonicus yFS275]
METQTLSNVAPTAQESPSSNLRLFQGSSHPVALFFFLFFRGLALAMYFLGYLVLSNFMLVFVITVVLLSMDLWTVKNVSGRLLVGLRWHNEVGPNGESIWVFESADPSRPKNAMDHRMFWLVLYSTPVVWFILAVVALARFEFLWFCLVCIAFVLSSINTVAYTRCDKDARRKWATDLATSAATSSLVSRFLPRAFLGRFFG